MGRELREAEKGREKERVEKQKSAMTTWRDGGGRKSSRGDKRYKRGKRSKKGKREKRERKG